MTQPISSRIILLLIILSTTACSLSFTGLEFRRGQSAAKDKDYPGAIKHFRRVIQRDPESKEAVEAAREASKISFFETKNFDEAITFYDHLVRFSRIEKERREAQAKIASIFFENKNDYLRAIEEYNKIILLRNSPEEAADIRFNLARAHFYLNHFTEAQGEIELALKTIDNEEKKFDYLMFLGSIFFNTKQADRAVKIYEDIVMKYPERAKTDKVEMNIIVCYEEMEAFDSAISRLQKMRSSYEDVEFIDLKIKRLKERKANLPGSKGLRK